jgi:methyl-accepting chemotaxis protein
MASIAASSDAVRTGTTEITRAADDLSRRTEQTAASLEETAAALNELTETVRRTAEGARKADATVSATRKDAEKSGEIVRQAVAAMEQIETSAGQIGQIIGVIDEIAFQTNLLALNAGVEAARAEAAKEIKTLIAASAQHVGNGVALVDSTGEALMRIVASFGGITQLVSDMAASAEAQSTGIAEINVAIGQMDQSTQQNAAMVEQSTAAAYSLAKEADGMAALVGRFETGAAAGRAGRAPSAAPRHGGAPAVRTQQARVAAFASNRSAAQRRPEAPAPDSWEEF